MDVATAAPSTARLNAMAKARNAARTFIGSRLVSRSAPSRRNNCRHLDFKTEEKAPFPRIIQIESTSTYDCNVVTRRCRALLFLLVRFGLMSACVWLAVNCGPGPTIPAQPQTSFGLVSQESVAGAVRHDIELPPERPRPTDRGRAAHPPDQGLGANVRGPLQIIPGFRKKVRRRRITQCRSAEEDRALPDNCAHAQLGAVDRNKRFGCTKRAGFELTDTGCPNTHAGWS